jgi:hypothetical protein
MVIISNNPLHPSPPTHTMLGGMHSLQLSLAKNFEASAFISGETEAQKDGVSYTVELGSSQVSQS